MTEGGWPAIKPDRFGAGVVIEARVLWALRVAVDPDHERVARRVLSLAEQGLPLVLSYLSLAEAAVRIHGRYGPVEALALIQEARDLFNVLVPGEKDLETAEKVLDEGAEQLTLEQAVAGTMAKRLGCSIYGFSPAYHLFRVAVIVE